MTEPASAEIVHAVVAAVLLIGVLGLYLIRFARSWRWAAIALVVCVLDQAAKTLVYPGIEHERISLLGGWLRLTYAENYEQGFGGSFPHLLITTAVCAGALYVLYERLLKRRYRMSPLAEFGVALMIGGYLGILLDRIRFGFVVDFLEFGRASAFVYNIADLTVFLAVALLLGRGVQFLGERSNRRMEHKDSAPGWPKG